MEDKTVIEDVSVDTDKRYEVLVDAYKQNSLSREKFSLILFVLSTFFMFASIMELSLASILSSITYIAAVIMMGSSYFTAEKEISNAIESNNEIDYKPSIYQTITDAFNKYSFACFVISMIFSIISIII